MLWSKVLLKNTILFYCKVCCCATKACAQGCVLRLLRHCMLLILMKICYGKLLLNVL